MKKIPGILFFIAVIIFTVSCQKEISEDLLTNPTNNNNNSTVDFKVRTYTESVTSQTAGNSSQTFNLAYDSNDRLISMIDRADSTNKFLYNYASDSYTLDMYVAGSLSIHEDFFLNSIPLIDSTLQYNDTHDTTTEKSVYNASGKLIQYKGYDYSAATGSQQSDLSNYTYDTEGNIAQETESSGRVTTYTYDTAINTINVGLKYEPRNPNLTKMTTITEGGTTTVINHTYSFDASNRIISERQEYNSGNIAVKSYTY